MGVFWLFSAWVGLVVLVVCGLGGVGLGVVLDGFPGHFRLLWVWYNMRLLGFATCGLLRIFGRLAVLVIYGLDSVLGGFPGCFRFLWGWYNISLRVDCVCGCCFGYLIMDLI